MAAEDSKQARFKVSAAKGYMPIEPALRNYLSDQAGNGKGVQHFCVVGYKLPSKNAAKETLQNLRTGTRYAMLKP